MGIQPLLRALGLVLAVLTGSPASGDVISGDVVGGTGYLTEGCWDFSESRSVVDFDPGADVCVVYVVEPPLGYMVATANFAVIAVVDSAFDDVTVAPEDTTVYGYDYVALQNVTYVVRTAEGNYAKFHILQFLPVAVIEYAYQPDGSHTLVAAEGASWGRVKAIYR